MKSRAGAQRLTCKPARAEWLCCFLGPSTLVFPPELFPPADFPFPPAIVYGVAGTRKKVEPGAGRGGSKMRNKSNSNGRCGSRTVDGDVLEAVGIVLMCVCEWDVGRLTRDVGWIQFGRVLAGAVLSSEAATAWEAFWLVRLREVAQCAAGHSRSNSETLFDDVRVRAAAVSRDCDNFVRLVLPDARAGERSKRGPPLRKSFLSCFLDPRRPRRAYLWWLPAPWLTWMLWPAMKPAAVAWPHARRTYCEAAGASCKTGTMPCLSRRRKSRPCGRFQSHLDGGVVVGNVEAMAIGDDHVPLWRWWLC